MAASSKVPRVVTKILAGGANPTESAEGVRTPAVCLCRCIGGDSLKKRADPSNHVCVRCDAVNTHTTHARHHKPTHKNNRKQASVKGEWQRIPMATGGDSSTHNAHNATSAIPIGSTTTTGGPSSPAQSFASRVFTALYGEMNGRDLVRVSWFAGTLFFIIGWVGGWG